MTQAELETVYTVDLSPVTSVLGTDIASPSPVDVADKDIENKFSLHSVSTGSISTISITAPEDVTYDQVTTDDEVTNESLNRTAESLSKDVNEKLGTFSSNIADAINNLSSDTDTQIQALKNSVNDALQALKTDGDNQVSEIDTKIDSIIAEVNIALEDIRVKNLDQSNQTATKINEIAGELSGRDEALKLAIDNAQAKIAALDDVYGTDTEFAARVAEVNSLLDTIRGTDLDVVSVLNSAVDELNVMKRVQTKILSINSGNGVYNFNLSAEGFGEFLNSTDYNVTLNVINAPKTQAYVDNKTESSFDIYVKSEGVHFVPQPIDCSVKSVTVEVVVTHNKRNPMTFEVDVLNDSFVTDGAGTDATYVGAMILSTETVDIAVDETADVVISAAEGDITLGSSDEDVATVTYDAETTTATITGVAAGSATITITDGQTVKTVEVTVS